MKKIKFLSLFMASLLLFVFFNLFCNNLRAEERTPAQVNYQVDFWYKETLDFYQQGQYAEAKDKLNKIIKTLATNPPAVIWRSSHKMEPPQETFYKMLKQTEERIEWKKVEQKQTEQKELQRKKRELARQKQEKEKQLAEEKAGREQERKAREEELAKQKEERLKQQQELKAKQEQERKAREAELAKQKQGKEKQLAEEKARQEQKRKARESEPKAQKQKEAQEKQPKREAAGKPKEEKSSQQRLKEQTELEAKKQGGQKAKQAELAREREKLETKLNEMKRASVQEKAMTEAMLNKHRHDQAKLKKIEELWVRARRLYNQGMYEQAIKDFDEIIKLEGNPRIKYTPSALEYIDKAKNNLIQKKEGTLTKGLEQTEKEMVNEVLKQQVLPYIEPPKRIEEREPVPLIEPPEIRKKLKTIKITMDFDKVGLKPALAFLAQESGVNFVASQKVLELASVVSARFKETSLDEVIKYITKNLGLVYRIDKEIVWVAHPEEIANEPMETRVYYLNRGGGLFTEFSPVSSGTTETALGGSSAQITKVYTIEDTLKEVVSWPADAKLTYDKRINALIVRNTPQNLQMLEDMLYSLDVEPLQVLIEARFLEVNISDTKELGVDWNLTGGDLQLKESGSGAFKKGIGTGSGVDFTAFTRAAEGLNLTYKGMLTNSQFQAVLHALEETKKIKTLSSPRITTLNNQLATMKVVDEWIYPTRYEYEIVQFDLNGDGDFSDAGETTFKNVPKDFLRRDVGILLKVIPSVGADKKTISLSLIPEVSEGTADAFTYTGDVKLPMFTSRNLSTTVVVNSGETVVLGGMIKESRTKTTTRVPVLGHIPLLGALFKKNTDSISRKNLLIFVTAKVLSPSGEEVVIAQK